MRSDYIFKYYFILFKAIAECVKELSEDNHCRKSTATTIWINRGCWVCSCRCWRRIVEGAKKIRTIRLELRCNFDKKNKNKRFLFVVLLKNLDRGVGQAAWLGEKKNSLSAIALWSHYFNITFQSGAFVISIVLVDKNLCCPSNWISYI